MSQITTGIRSILSAPTNYNIMQRIMGIDTVQRWVVAEFVRPATGKAILDIGCGTAYIAKFMPADITYIGFDISSRYIAEARRRHPTRGPFFDRLLTYNELPALPLFDIAIATGLLHHLSDAEATDLFRLVKSALKPEGRFITLDPCIVEPQNPIARLIINHDRGCNVRNPDGYERLARSVFANVQGEVRHRRWIPYTHWIMECSSTDLSNPAG